MEAENNGHLFWQCGKTRDIWTTSRIPFDSSGVHFNEFVDLLWHLKFVLHVGDKILELVITITWSIWFNRNQFLHRRANQTASLIIHKVRSMIEEFQVANFQPSRSSMKEVELWINLKPP